MINERSRYVKHTNNHSRIFTIAAFAFLFFVSSVYPAGVAFCSVEEEVARIQKAYEGLRDLSGEFVQQSHIRDLKQTQTYEGRFFIQKPLKMRWNYEGEQPQDILISEGKILIYQRNEKQAVRSDFDHETYGQAPIALLTGFGKIGEEFNVTEKNETLLLKPKKPMGGILSVEVEVAKEGFPIKSFTVIDSLSNRIRMSLNNVKVNPGLKNNVFSLKIPKDVKVFEY
jgi:outer membrane lipoprotein carrier protein